MIRFPFFVDAARDTEAIRRQLGDVFEPRFFSLDHIREQLLESCVVFDIDLRDIDYLNQVREALKQKAPGCKAVFAVNKISRAEKLQAYALGATDLIHRPISENALLTILRGDFDSLSLDKPSSGIRSFPAIEPAFHALENVFAAAFLGTPIDIEKIESAGKALIDCIEAHGLGSWLAIVREHHSLTYQHSLIVTGVAVAFGQNLGFSAQDREKLAFAGMLHDIGKARIPVSILEKPGPLDKKEMAIIRKHPLYGFDALKSVPDLPKGMLDMVVHHHEYLDGSGYPHGLQAAEISDLVRIMTISDIFGALVERRPYREPMSGEQAYQILLDMGPKLDKELVREFRFARGLRVALPHPSDWRPGNMPALNGSAQ